MFRLHLLIYAGVDLMPQDGKPRNCYGISNPFKRTVALELSPAPPAGPTP